MIYVLPPNIEVKERPPAEPGQYTFLMSTSGFHRWSDLTERQKNYWREREKASQA